MAKIAFMGLGRMGSGMAARLLAVGHDVAVWNRTPEKATPLAALGAAMAETPAIAATDADAIIVMVADDRASFDVWLGAGGVLEVAKPGTLAIECSTLSVTHVDLLFREVSDRGLAYVDCPVTGWPDAAAAGALTLLVGANAETLEKARPVLSAIGTTIRHFGPVGTGTAFKLINNLLGAVHIAALAEAVVMAERFGLDREVVVAALEAGAVASPQVRKHARPMTERRFSAAPPFSAGLRLKDADYCLIAAVSAGAVMPVGAAAADWFRQTADVDFDADEGRVVETVAAATS